MFSDLKPYTVPMWKLLVARLFGKRLVTSDAEWRMVAYEWRGVIYIHSFERVDTGNYGPDR